MGWRGDDKYDRDERDNHRAALRGLSLQWRILLWLRNFAIPLIVLILIAGRFVGLW